MAIKARPKGARPRIAYNSLMTEAYVRTVDVR